MDTPLAFALCALCFFSSILSFVPSWSECTHLEEKYYTVGMDTFRFKQDNKGRGLSESNASPDVASARSGGLNVQLTHLEPTLNMSWRDAWFQRLEKDNVRVNHILAHAFGSASLRSNSDLTAAGDGGGGRKIPVQSGGEFQASSYLVTLAFGTPPRNQLMTIDTFIDLSRIYCNPCSDCASPKLPMFEPRGSSSFQTVGCKLSKCPPLGGDPLDIPSSCDNRGVCNYNLTYSEGQVSKGNYITETLSVGSDKFTNVTLACMHEYTKPRVDGPSGELGLGKGPLSIVSQKYGGQFSYCLPDYTSADATGSLMLGEGSIPPSVKMFTPIERVDDFTSTAYIVSLEGISVGGQRLNVSLQQPIAHGSPIPITVINSGTLTTQLVSPVYQALKDSFVQKMKNVQKTRPFGTFDICYKLSDLGSVRVPTITFHFKGNANVDVRDIGTLVQVSENVVCLAFADSGSGSSVNFIGDIQQQRLRVVFDNVNKRVGFAPEDC